MKELFKKWRDNRFVSFLISAARKIAKWIEKKDLSKKDIDVLRRHIIYVSGKDISGLEKGIEVAQWLAERYFNKKVNFTVRLIVQIVYTIARIQGALKNK